MRAEAEQYYYNILQRWGDSEPRYSYKQFSYIKGVLAVPLTRDTPAFLPQPCQRMTSFGTKSLIFNGVLQMFRRCVIVIRVTIGPRVVF